MGKVAGTRRRGSRRGARSTPLALTLLALVATLAQATLPLAHVVDMADASLAAAARCGQASPAGCTAPEGPAVVQCDPEHHAHACALCLAFRTPRLLDRAARAPSLLPPAPLSQGAIGGETAIARFAPRHAHAPRAPPVTRSALCTA